MDNDWFSAKFPGNVEVEDDTSKENDLHIRSKTFSSSIDGKIGVFTIRISWIDSLRAMASSPDLATVMVHEYLKDLVNQLVPDDQTELTFELDKTETLADGVCRRFLFHYMETKNLTLACMGQIFYRPGTIVQNYAVVERSQEGIDSATKFMESVKFKPL